MLSLIWLLFSWTNFRLEMVYSWRSLLLLTLLCHNFRVDSFDPRRFPGPYCRTRFPEQCCPGRDDECTVNIADTKCYCDEFCYQHSVEDCCPDYMPICRGQKTDEKCQWNGRLLSVGEKYKSGCNECVCSTSGLSCSNDPCLNNGGLINKINARSFIYGWTAKNYSKFEGVKLKDAACYFLGTNYPANDVIRQRPLYIPDDIQIPKEFDSTEKWKNMIQLAKDQGQFGSSWAFSTASVASDRWSIESFGLFNYELSAQQLIDCGKQKAQCQGGKVEDAWWFLKSYGVFQASCYPYVSGTTGKKGNCTLSRRMVCNNNDVPHLFLTTPAYRISHNETEIRYEVMYRGPVQAIMKVRSDFFLYEKGVYQHIQEIHHGDSFIGYHSVKIIGWGEENGVKYWVAVNSWGTDWGENGLFRIVRGENESGIEDFIIAAWARVGHKDMKSGRRKFL